MFSYCSRIFLLLLLLHASHTIFPFLSICSVLLMNLQSFRILRLYLFSSYVPRLLLPGCSSPPVVKTEKVHRVEISWMKNRCERDESNESEMENSFINSFIVVKYELGIHKSSSLWSWFLFQLCHRGLARRFRARKSTQQGFNVIWYPHPVAPPFSPWIYEKLWMKFSRSLGMQQQVYQGEILHPLRRLTLS